MSMTRVRAVVAGMALLVLSVGCSGGDNDSAGSDAAGTTPTAPVVQGFQAQHKGGVLHLMAKAAAGSVDPQVNYSLQFWQLFQATYDGLLAFKKVGGPESFILAPDLAESMPHVIHGGNTYVFKLRRGIKFSNGKPVTVEDVVASFERIFKVSSPTAGTFYNGIVGAAACLKQPADCSLSKGVIGNRRNRTVTINLTAPDPEFPYKLAVPHATVLPKGSPAKDSGTKPLPGTGPYKIASYDPNRALKLVRNPDFKEWSPAAQPQGYPDQIIETFGLTVEAEVTAVENGQGDWVFDPPPADRLNEMGTRYQKQVHVNPLTAFFYLTLNTNLPPFDNQLARQAINWAVDRAATVRLYGGPNLAQPACTILPPGFPGHVNFCPYTKGGGTSWTAPDIDKAKQLVQQSGTAGRPVAVVVQQDEVNRSIGEYVQSLLNQIGYKATLKPLAANIQFTYIQNTKNKAQMALTSWYQDYPAASDFLNVLLSCASFHPGSDSSVNIAGFCDKDIDARMKDALQTEQIGMPTANRKWGQIDQAVMQKSPLVPLFNPKLVDFVSARVGNYQFSKQFYMIVSQLWVK
jgi:peptide/nickel transport system substrate-binding protein